MFSHRIDDELEFRLPEEWHAEESNALIKQNYEYLREWLPWVRDDAPLSHTKDFIRQNLQRFADDDDFSMQMVFRGRLAGHIGFNNTSRENRKTEIGYWLAAAFQGHGIVTRACRALVVHAFDERKLNRVEILCGVGNVRSRRIPERLGFRQEGVLRQAEWLHERFHDLVVYAMLADEWRAITEGRNA
ncbi:MAG TPA: GNAT family protein [Pyrinomonadaceae bacterium]|jgi:ribosomal-protein-serine acetyltransferase|nr:GNAT family protein [Pyrinomonadaceae bacterium]